MKLNKITADMVSRRPDQTAEWLNRLARQVDIVETDLGSMSKKPWDLPIATTYSLGVIKVGQNLSITPEGVLSALAPASYDYTLLFNKPKINNVELVGNKSLSDIGVGDATIKIQKNSVDVDSFTTNATSNKTIDISVPTQTSDLANNGADGTSTYVEADELATVATSGSYSDLLNKPTIGNATLTIQKNGTNVDTFTANATSNKTINITVPTTAADVNALPDSTKYAASLSLTINSSTYVVTGQLKDQDGNNLGTAQTIDLPLESVVVSGSYDSATKEVVLVLENGSEIRFSVADLVSGLQSEITSANPLDADLVDDSTSTNKFVTATEIAKLNGIQAGAEVNVQSDWTEADNTSDAYIKNKPSLATVATSGDYNDLSNKPTIGNATLTIQKNGTNVQTFTANATSNKTANITVPTKTSDITNDGADGTSTYVENDDLTTALAGKQDTLTAGTNINLVSNTISTQTRGIEYIVGTQASATNLWTGVSTDNGCSSGTLYTGKTIVYHLPYAGNNSAATLNLTLPDGTTTGAKNVRYNTGSNVGTTYGAGCDIFMVFDGTYWKTSAWYDSNNYDRIRYYNNVTAAAAISGSRICVGTDAGYIMAAANATFDINYPILWAGSAVNSGATSTNFYGAYPGANLTNNKSGWSGTAKKMTFLVGTLSGTTFTIDSAVFTQTVPSAEDGKIYVPLGIAYSTTNILFYPNNTYWAYKNGKFRPISHSEPVMTGADSGTAGTAGLVPAPAAGDNTKYLSGDGTWKTVSQYALPIATANDLGGIKVGSELSINSSTGVLSANNNKVTQTITKPATTTSYYPVSSTNSSTNTADVKKFSGYKLDYDDDEGGVAKLNLGYSSLNGSVAGKLSMIDSVSATGATTICGSGKASSTNHTLYSPDTSGRLVANSSDSTATGANNRPVYADANGVLQQINYTVDANVPSGALFTDTTYSAGNGLTLTGTTFSVDSTVVALQSDIPTVNNATLTIQKNGTTVKTFTANASSNVTANISVPTKTSDLTNDSGFVTDTTSQNFAAQEGSTNPVFDDMTPVKVIEWDVSDTTYRPIYQMENTGWTYDNMDVTLAYRITVTGTNIKSVSDVIARWHSPNTYPVTSILHRTLSTSASTTGLRYLRAVYPTSSYVNNNTYKFGQEVAMYNSTARHVKVEVFKNNSKAIWSETKPAGSIYQGSSTYQSTNNLEPYATRGWYFRGAANVTVNNADAATRISDYEPYSPGSSVLKSGATALVAGHFAFLAEDGLVYDISNTAKAISVGESKVGWIASGVNANTAINQSYWRMISRPNATQYGYFSHDTMALGDRVYLRCTMDSSGKIHSDNYLAKSMSPGYTWMPMGFMTAATTFYADTRFPKFYTLDADGNMTHMDGIPLISYANGNSISY